jgi:hypothetical protein
MGKYGTKSKAKSGVPVWVWVLAGVGVLAVAGLISFFVIRGLQGSADTAALPAASEMPALPRPHLPEGRPLPSAEDTPSLPQAPPLPQAQTPEPTPEPPPAPEPQPEAPSGVVYWAATVHPFTSNMPIAQPQPGTMFVTALFKVVNKSTVTVHVEHNLTSIEYQGRIYYPYVWASGMDAMANRRFLSPVDLLSSSMTEGYVAFQIPAGAQDVKPHFTPQGLPPTVQVRQVQMSELPNLSGPAPTQGVR